MSKRSKAKKKRASRRNGENQNSIVGFSLPVIHQAGPFAFSIRLTNSGALTNSAITSLNLRGIISVATSTTAVAAIFTCYRLRRACLYAQRYTGSTAEGIDPLTMEFATSDAPRGIIVTGDFTSSPGVIMRVPPKKSTLGNWKNVSNDSDNMLIVTAPVDSYLDVEITAYLNYSGSVGTTVASGLSGLTVGALYYGISTTFNAVDLPDFTP